MRIGQVEMIHRLAAEKRGREERKSKREGKQPEKSFVKILEQEKMKTKNKRI